MRKLFVVLFTFCFILTACMSNKSVTTFKATIDGIHEDKLIVNCSDEVNRGKKGAIDSIGYLCDVNLNSTTSFSDHNGNALLLEDFSVGDLIQINLTTPQNVTESNRHFDATEIVLLEVHQSK